MWVASDNPRRSGVLPAQQIPDPRHPGGSQTILKKHRWLPHFGPALSVAVPRILAVGVPNLDYSEHWSIVEWIDGQVSTVPVGPRCPQINSQHVPLCRGYRRRNLVTRACLGAVSRRNDFPVLLGVDDGSMHQPTRNGARRLSRCPDRLTWESSDRRRQRQGVDQRAELRRGRHR